MAKRKNGMPRSVALSIQPKTIHQHAPWQIRVSDGDGSKYCAACGETVEEN